MITHLSTIDMYEYHEDDKRFSIRKVSSWQTGDEEWTVMFGNEKIEPGSDLFKSVVRAVQDHLMRRNAWS